MKRPVVFITLLSFVLIALLIHSCRKEPSGSGKASHAALLADPSAELNISLAETYYYGSLKPAQGDKVKGRAQASSDNKLPNRKYLIFGKGYASVKNNVSFVEIPVLYNQRSSVVPGNEKGDKATSIELFRGSFDRLLIYKSRRTGKIDQRIVTYIPELNYIRRHGHDISHNRIDKLDADFNGYLEYKKWDGTRLFILKIVNGKSVKRMIYPPAGSSKGQVGTRNSYVCSYFEIPVWGESCVTVDPEGGMNGGIGGEEYCEPYLIGYEQIPVYCEGQEPTGDPCVDYGIDCPTGDPCLDYGIDCEGGTDPAPEPDPCQSRTTYDKNGARILSECENRDITYEGLNDKPCAKELLKKLQSIEGFSKLVNYYASNNGSFNLVWGHEAYTWNGPFLAGKTIYDWEGTLSNVNINLNTHMLDESSDLIIAATAIHEAFHAYLAAIYNYNKEPNSPDYFSYSQLVEKYGNDHATSNVPSHIFIADRITEMASILSKYDNNSITDDPNYYLKLCMGSFSAESNSNLSAHLNSVLTALGFSQSQVNSVRLAEIAATGLEKGDKLGVDCN